MSQEGACTNITHFTYSKNRGHARKLSYWVAPEMNFRMSEFYCSKLTFLAIFASLFFLVSPASPQDALNPIELPEQPRSVLTARSRMQLHKEAELLMKQLREDRATAYGLGDFNETAWSRRNHAKIASLLAYHMELAKRNIASDNQKQVKALDHNPSLNEKVANLLIAMSAQYLSEREVIKRLKATSANEIETAIDTFRKESHKELKKLKDLHLEIIREDRDIDFFSETEKKEIIARIKAAANDDIPALMTALRERHKNATIDENK